jgi:hypothetical protein
VLPFKTLERSIPFLDKPDIYGLHEVLNQIVGELRSALCFLTHPCTESFGYSSLDRGMVSIDEFLPRPLIRGTLETAF